LGAFGVPPCDSHTLPLHVGICFQSCELTPSLEPLLSLIPLGSSILLLILKVGCSPKLGSHDLTQWIVASLARHLPSPTWAHPIYSL